MTAGSPQATCGRRPSRLLPSIATVAEAETEGQRIPARHRLAAPFDAQGQALEPVWLLPEPWPKHKPNLEITCHAPP